MSGHPTIARSAHAALHRLNRNRRNVAIAARVVDIAFRLLPPILWDWSDGYLWGLHGRTWRVLSDAAMARACAADRRHGLARWQTGRTLTWYFGLTRDGGSRHAM